MITDVDPVSCASYLVRYSVHVFELLDVEDVLLGAVGRVRGRQPLHLLDLLHIEVVALGVLVVGL